jgi:hypothetical protein
MLSLSFSGGAALPFTEKSGAKAGRVTPTLSYCGAQHTTSNFNLEPERYNCRDVTSNDSTSLNSQSADV